MKHRYIAQPKFWMNYRNLPAGQQQSTKAAWQIFKIDPFDPRLRTHRINFLTSIFRRPVYATVIEGELSLVFYIQGDTVVTVNIGSHCIYKEA